VFYRPPDFQNEFYLILPPLSPTSSSSNVAYLKNESVRQQLPKPGTSGDILYISLLLLPISVISTS
jgi:hypothetical protein